MKSKPPQQREALPIPKIANPVSASEAEARFHKAVSRALATPPMRTGKPAGDSKKAKPKK